MTMVGSGRRVAVGRTAGLVGLGLGGLLLGRGLGICNNFDLQHVVIPPGRVSTNGMVACNSELLLLQNREVVQTTLFLVAGRLLQGAKESEVVGGLGRRAWTGGGLAER